MQVLLSSASHPDETIAATAADALQRACMIHASSFASWLPLFFTSLKSSGPVTARCITLIIVCSMKCSSSLSTLQQLSV